MSFFNPLNAVTDVSADKELESNSKAMKNDTQGVCPKCSTSMKTVSLKQEDVFYCTSCRVTSPKLVE